MALLQNRRGDAQVLMESVIGSEGIIFDQTFAKLFLSVKPDNLDFLVKYQEAYDTNLWYVYLRGLNHYNHNEYGLAYDFLQIALKKMKQVLQKKTESGAQGLPDDNSHISLAPLNSGRYSSKALFSSSYIRGTCPVLFCDLLSNEELQVHINRVNFIVCVLNKLLGKPKTALNGLKALTELIFSESGQAR